MSICVSRPQLYLPSRSQLSNLHSHRAGYRGLRGEGRPRVARTLQVKMPTKLVIGTLGPLGGVEEMRDSISGAQNMD